MPAQTQEMRLTALDQGPIDAGPLAQISPGTAVRVIGGSVDIALVNDRGTLFAFSDLCLRCSHALSDGTLSGGLLTCSHCGWQYELERGCVAGLPGLRIEKHRVCIEGGRIYIDPPAGTAPARFS